MKSFYLIILLFSINCFSQDEFITVWQTNPIETSTETSISFITTVNDSTYSYVWQQVDGNFTELTPFSTETIVPINNGNITIDFPEAGFYRLKITTNSTQFHFNGNSLKLLRIEQWGNINWSSFSGSFSHCLNLDVTATDIPNLENVTNMSYMFSNCPNLIYNNTINLWNTSNVQKFEQTFSNSTSFNQPIGNWNMSSATTLELMFLGANSFNQPIGTWIVDNVTNFRGLFHYNTGFNQPLEEWNVSSGTDFEHMFCGTTKFNQPLDKWNVQNGTKMKWMFNGSNKFNQDLSNWKLNSIEDGENFFNFCGMNCTNFTNTMLSWANNSNLASGIDFGIADMKYSPILTPVLEWYENTKNWTFEGIAIEYPNCSLNNYNIKQPTIKIYPNPTSNLINIEGLDAEKIDIYDAKGSLVQKTLNNNQVDISNLSSGNYILIINDLHTEKIIKK